MARADDNVDTLRSQFSLICATACLDESHVCVSDFLKTTNLKNNRIQLRRSSLANPNDDEPNDTIKQIKCLATDLFVLRPAEAHHAAQQHAHVAVVAAASDRRDGRTKRYRECDCRANRKRTVEQHKHRRSTSARAVLVLSSSYPCCYEYGFCKQTNEHQGNRKKRTQTRRATKRAKPRRQRAGERRFVVRSLHDGLLR